MVIRAMCRKAAFCYRMVRDLTSRVTPVQRRAELLLEQPRNLTGIRKSAGRFLAEDQLPVNRDLEAPAAPALELDRAHDRRPPAQQLAGQAHGLVKVVSRYAVFDLHFVERVDHFARMRLFFGLCSTSARPSASSSGGMYMPKRPRNPFFRPYQPPTGFFGDLPHASTVPSAAGFCSSALPSGTQSPCFLSIAWRSSIARISYRSSVLPTMQTIAGGSSDSSLYIRYSDDPLAVVSCHGDCLVPAPFTFAMPINSDATCDQKLRRVRRQKRPGGYIGSAVTSGMSRL